MKNLTTGRVALILAAVTLFTLGHEQHGQQLGSSGQIGQRQENTPAAPAPRRPDGRVVLGSPPGGIGMWLPFNGGNERLVNPDNITAEAMKQFPGRPKVSEVPFQPWARELYSYRRANQLEPHTRCKPSGGPRQFLTPYGVEFVELPELQRILIVDQGGPHTIRTIYMDGRPHPKDWTPTFYGHSIGRWDSDTLVVDTAGFNENFWFDRSGLPHTDRLHMIERFTRTDSKTMKYEVTIDDPGAYTRVWSGGFILGWDPGQELFEYVCQDNNLASSLMVGSQESIERPSRIAP
jgi:hypothetical protein